MPLRKCPAGRNRTGPGPRRQTASSGPNTTGSPSSQPASGNPSLPGRGPRTNASPPLRRGLPTHDKLETIPEADESDSAPAMPASAGPSPLEAHAGPAGAGPGEGADGPSASTGQRRTPGMRARLSQLFDTKKVLHEPAVRLEGNWETGVAEQVCTRSVPEQAA